MSSTTLTYNGFTNLDTVRIVEWRQEPVLAEDGVSQETTRHVISGTALVATSDASTWKGYLDDARAKLNQPRKNLTVDINGQTLLSITAPDDRDGPFPRFDIQEIVGSLCAFARFTIEVFDYRRPSASDTYADAISHRWVQHWTHDHVGLATRRVSGSLAVRASALASSASSVASQGTGINAGSNPEAYRALVAPTLPPGFRRMRAEFATDETGNRLVYTFEDREFPRGLPAPLKAGDCSFTWSKPVDNMGTKVFTCEVEGDAHTTSADLLKAAADLSSSKIVYVPNAQFLQADLIVLMEVTEHDMLSRNRLSFRVVARSTASATGQLVPSNVPMLTDILEGISGGAGYSPPTVYGNAKVRGTRRELWSPSYSGTPTFPTAEWETVGGTVNVPIYTLPEPVFEQLLGAIIPQSGAAGTATASAIANAYLHVEVSERIAIQSNIIALESMTFFDKDVPFQWRKPRVHLVSELSAVRLNKSPEGLLRPPPSYSFLVEDDEIVRQGQPDANGNVAMMLRRRRVLRIMDPGATAPASGNAGFQNQLGGDGVSYRIFWPKKLTLARPLDPRVVIGQSPAGSQSIIDAQTLPDSYQLGPADIWMRT